jgi:acetaldehyde dehydrogenase (acetylating)
MFESVRPDPGADGLARAARIFYVLTVLSGITLAVRIVQRHAVMMLFAAVSAALAYITAKGIEGQRPWARALAYIQAVVVLFNFPVGTVVGIAVLVYVSRASKAGLFAPPPVKSS